MKWVLRGFYIACYQFRRKNKNIKFQFSNLFCSWESGLCIESENRTDYLYTKVPIDVGKSPMSRFLAHLTRLTLL